MDTPSASQRGLARQLLAAEAVGESGAHPRIDAAARVCEKLRISLSRFAGPDGFAALLRRAMALARAEAPLLKEIRGNSDGSLAGLETLAADATNSTGDGEAEAAEAIVVQLLGLLVAFVGESLTLRMVREIWPDESLER